MYELFILGKLMHRPMHGYLLQSIINAALGPHRRLGWGTLYPLLRRLEQGGLIGAVRSGKAADGRRTKTYRATALGRERFFELMRSSDQSCIEQRDLFRIRLSNFGHLGTEDQLAILAAYRHFLTDLASHSEAMAGEVRKAPGLADTERPYVLKAIDHQRHLAASEATWVDNLIRVIGGEHEHKADNNRVHSKHDGDHRRRPGARAGSARRQ
jgi:DNA-binding PadR family transcriptional regulator